MSELNLILLGPPGSGKGTQGERLQEDLQLPYYATGDILRAAVREGTEIGTQAKEYMDRGDLVPDDVIVGVIAERIDRAGGRGRLHPRRLPAHRAAGRGARREARRARPRGLGGDPDRGPRRGGRAPARRPPDLPERAHLPRRVRPAREGGRLRRLRRAARGPRRRQARGDPQPARPVPREDRAADRLLRVARAAASGSTATRPPEEVTDRIRALLATLRMEEEA